MSLAAPQPLLTALEREIVLTRPFLERLPDNQFGWQPHPKSRPLGELASHIANILGNIHDTLNTGSFDLALEDEYPQPVTSRAAALARFDANAATARAALSAADEAALAHVWTFYYGEQVIFRQPRAQIVRELLLDHLIHHRAQLGLYLRLLDLPVPGTYGPTADEPEFDFDFAASARFM
jgi:uncharacterized damage-inducible protein DinB